MKSAKNHDPFPGWLPWEDFTEIPVTIEELRIRVRHHELALTIHRLTTQTAPGLPANAVRRLLAQREVTLDAEARVALDGDLYAIGLWYLIPAAQRAADADIDATRRYLKELRRLADEIGPSLHHVLALFQVSIPHHLEQMPEWVEGGHQFDLEMVRAFFKLLPELSRRLAADVEVRRKGRRKNFVLDHSVRLAAAAFAQAGLAVIPRGQSATSPQPRLTGDGSRLFVDYFRLLDGHLGEPALAAAQLRSRKAGRAIRT